MDIEESFLAQAITRGNRLFHTNAQVIGDLCDDLARTLVQAGTGARRLDLHFERIDGHRR